MPGTLLMAMVFHFEERMVFLRVNAGNSLGVILLQFMLDANEFMKSSFV